MGENAVLAIYLLFVVGSGLGLWLFFRKLRMHRRPTAVRLISGNLLVLCFLGALAVLGGEVYFRFIYDTTDSFGLTKTTQRWFARHFENNSVGVRDSQSYLMRAQPGTRRITFLGDSFTAGHGVADVEDRFVNRVRRMIPEAEVHMLAQPGMDTGAEAEYLRAVADMGYELDVVVLVYCLNDISDIVPQWQAILDRIYERPDPGFWIQNSYLLNWLYYRRVAAQDPDVSNYYSFVGDNYEGPVWTRQAQRLSSFHQEVASRGGQLLVVTFPFLHNLGPGYGYHGVHKKLSSFWKDEGVPHLDLLPAFEPFAPGDVVVNRYDAHPNERAHALAAEAIARFLNEHLKL